MCLQRLRKRGVAGDYSIGERVYNVVGFVKGQFEYCEPGAGSEGGPTVFVGPFIADP